MNAKNENAVVFCCDDGHLPMAYFVANQIHEVEQDRKFDIIICIPRGIETPDYIVPDVAKIVHLDVEELTGISLQRKWISTATFYRILLPTVFRGVYQKLLYLDTDVYLRRPGIQSLFNETTDNIPLAACLEPSHFILRRQNKAQQTTKDRIALLGGRAGSYFNAGLLLIEPEAFLQMDGVNKFWRAYEENIDIISGFGEQDQGALNKAFADDIRQISPLFNWHTGALANATMVQHFNPIVLHFAGRFKPWNRNDDAFISSFTPEYLEFFASNSIDFSFQPAINSAEFRRKNPKYKSKIANWVSRHRYLRRRLGHQWQNEFYDLEFKKDALQTLISQSVLGTKT